MLLAGPLKIEIEIVVLHWPIHLGLKYEKLAGPLGIEIETVDVPPAGPLWIEIL